MAAAKDTDYTEDDNPNTQCHLHCKYCIYCVWYRMIVPTSKQTKMALIRRPAPPPPPCQGYTRTFTCVDSESH